MCIHFHRWGTGATAALVGNRPQANAVQNSPKGRICTDIKQSFCFGEMTPNCHNFSWNMAANWKLLSLILLFWVNLALGPRSTTPSGSPCSSCSSWAYCGVPKVVSDHGYFQWHLVTLSDPPEVTHDSFALFFTLGQMAHYRPGHESLKASWRDTPAETRALDTVRSHPAYNWTPTP